MARMTGPNGPANGAAHSLQRGGEGKCLRSFRVRRKRGSVPRRMARQIGSIGWVSSGAPSGSSIAARAYPRLDLEEVPPNRERGHDPDDHEDADPEIRRQVAGDQRALPILARHEPETDEHHEGDDVLRRRSRVEHSADDARDNGEPVVERDLHAAIGHRRSVPDPGPSSSPRRYVVIGPRPLTSTWRASTAYRPSSSARVDSASWIRPGTTDDSIPAAVFTVSPQRSNTIRRWPMTPPTTAPLASPTRTCSARSFASRHDATSPSMALANVRAASA